MKGLRKMSILAIIFAMAFTLFRATKAQVPIENMETFFDSEILGIKVQVNATAETQPAQNTSVLISLKGITDVYVEYFNASIFGFLNGTYKTIMVNITDSGFSLNNTLREYSRTFKVPAEAWGIAYGEITLTYRANLANLGGLKIEFPQLAYGFTMTYIENVYLKRLENDLEMLNEKYQQLGNKYELLNQTYWELSQNYTTLNQTYWELDRNIAGLEATRNTAVVLGITTAVFVITTVYMFMRKPKQYV